MHNLCFSTGQEAGRACQGQNIPYSSSGRTGRTALQYQHYYPTLLNATDLFVYFFLSLHSYIATSIQHVGTSGSLDFQRHRQ